MTLETSHRRTPRQDGTVLGIFVVGILWVALGSFVLYTQFSRPPSITIEWVTETEFDTVGYNIYRSDTPDGEFVQINPQLIPSEADPASGAIYSYIDDQVVSGNTYYYKLEDVEFNGRREQHDIISGDTPRLENWALLSVAVSYLLGLILITTAIRGWR